MVAREPQATVFTVFLMSRYAIPAARYAICGLREGGNLRYINILGGTVTVFY